MKSNLKANPKPISTNRKLSPTNNASSATNCEHAKMRRRSALLSSSVSATLTNASSESTAAATSSSSCIGNHHLPPPPPTGHTESSLNKVRQAAAKVTTAGPSTHILKRSPSANSLDSASSATINSTAVTKANSHQQQSNKTSNSSAKPSFAKTSPTKAAAAATTSSQQENQLPTASTTVLDSEEAQSVLKKAVNTYLPLYAYIIIIIKPFELIPQKK